MIFRNNLNGFWDFYHGTTVGAGSPKEIPYGIMYCEKPYVKSAYIN
jgi:hypothetical protein